MVEDGVDFGNEGEFVDFSFFRSAKDLLVDDDFIEEGVDRDFLIGCRFGVGEFDTGRVVELVDVDGPSCHANSVYVALCVFEDSMDGFFSSGEDSCIGIMLTGVILLSDHVDDAPLNSLDDVSCPDSFVNASRAFFQLFVSEVAIGDKELKCSGYNVVEVSVLVDDLRGELIGGEAGGRHAGCESVSSSCCC